VTGSTLTLSFSAAVDNAKVAAIAVLGTPSGGTPSAPNTPAAPTSSGVGNGTVTLHWVAPSTNGSAITGYNVVVSTSAAGTYANATGCTSLGVVLTCTATGLTNGTGYYFEVQAQSAAGNSSYSPDGGPFTPASSFALRIHAGGGSYVDSAGNTWLADTDYTGGSTYSTTAAIAGTSDPALFQTERYGMSAYTIPVPGPGTYTVQIYESENWWTSAGQRIFSITANGTPILTNYDIYAAVGANTADIITASVPVTGSTLTLSFSAAVDNAKVAAIAVIGP
jgi:hypothetical protein